VRAAPVSITATAGPFRSTQAPPVELFQTGQPGSDVHKIRILLVSLLLALPGQTTAAGLPDTIDGIRPGVVAVGTYMPLRPQQQGLRATGFVVAGNLAVTNAHSIPDKLDAGRRETVAVFVPLARDRAEVRPAKVVARDEAHDLALLRFQGPALPRLRLGQDGGVREGQAVAFTGFPILHALGLHPATHRGIVAAIVPVAIPVGSSRELSANVIGRLDKPFDIYQLDAVAYPGNSGSPVYDPDSGRVLAVVNSTFVKESKETAITAPSGISYAIPVRHVRTLLAGAGVKE
jgi:S1-C subfamily serine protease